MYSVQFGWNWKLNTTQYPRYDWRDTVSVEGESVEIPGTEHETTDMASFAAYCYNYHAMTNHTTSPAAFCLLPDFILYCPWIPPNVSGFPDFREKEVTLLSWTKTGEWNFFHTVIVTAISAWFWKIIKLINVSQRYNFSPTGQITDSSSE